MAIAWLFWPLGRTRAAGDLEAGRQPANVDAHSCGSAGSVRAEQTPKQVSSSERWRNEKEMERNAWNRR